MAAIASQAGFTGHGLELAVAVAMAESGGDPGNTHQNSDSHHSVDRGLWQLNSYWHREVSDSCAYKASCAAREAHRISNGGRSWSAWASFTNGSAQAQLGAAQDGVRAMRDYGGAAKYIADYHVPVDSVWHGGGGSILDDIPGAGAVGGALGLVSAPLSWGEGLASLLGKLNDSSTWLRGLEIVGGVVLMGGGLLIVARSVAGDAVAAAIPTPAGAAASAARSRPAAKAGGASTAAAGKGATSAAKGATATAAEAAAV